MPNPKHRHTSTRRDKRRTHDKAVTPQFAVCQATGVTHVRHHAHWHEGKLYYKGKVVIENEVAV